MSKIAEQRTDEIVGEYHDGDYTDHSRHNTRWCSFKEGYDQAVQDFMEKAERWLETHMPFGEVSHESVYDCIQEFKNYMQNKEK